MVYLAIAAVTLLIAVIACIALVFILGSRSVAELRNRREDEFRSTRDRARGPDPSLTTGRSENGQPHHR